MRLYSLALLDADPAEGAQQALVASGWRVDLLNVWADCGTSNAGFLVKNPSGFSITLMRSMGITGKSSMRGLWVRPKAKGMLVMGILMVKGGKGESYYARGPRPHSRCSPYAGPKFRHLQHDGFGW